MVNTLEQWFWLVPKWRPINSVFQHTLYSIKLFQLGLLDDKHAVLLLRKYAVFQFILQNMIHAVYIIGRNDIA